MSNFQGEMIKLTFFSYCSYNLRVFIISRECIINQSYMAQLDL